MKKNRNIGQNYSWHILFGGLEIKKLNISQINKIELRSFKTLTLIEEVKKNVK